MDATTFFCLGFLFFLGAALIRITDYKTEIKVMSRHMELQTFQYNKLMAKYDTLLFESENLKSQCKSLYGDQALILRNQTKIQAMTPQKYEIEYFEREKLKKPLIPVNPEIQPEKSDSPMGDVLTKLKGQTNAL